MKSTSIKSYYELVESGELSKKQIEVANCFKKHGPMTGRQVSTLIPGAWKRINELSEFGILTGIGVTKDKTTNKIVTIWKWTGDHDLHIPIPYNKARYREYEKGIRDTLAYCYHGMISEKLVEEILELRNKY